MDEGDYECKLLTEETQLENPNAKMNPNAPMPEFLSLTVRGAACPRISFTTCSRLDILPGEMGRKLRGISGREAIKAFQKLGYRQRKSKGSHVHLVKSGRSRLTIPLHTELSVGLLTNEIKKAGLTVEEFLQLLGR